MMILNIYMILMLLIINNIILNVLSGNNIYDSEFNIDNIIDSNNNNDNYIIEDSIQVNKNSNNDNDNTYMQMIKYYNNIDNIEMNIDDTVEFASVWGYLGIYDYIYIYIHI